MAERIISTKEKQLRNHKALATFFFVLMMVVYIMMVAIQKRHLLPGQLWPGYVRAFAEAAMVGALADWFAVTALFHHPMGLKIPHTNLIERKKRDIGDNLGRFVVDNFLTPTTLKPYIHKLEVASMAGRWLESDKNRRQILQETGTIFSDLIHQLDDEAIRAFLAAKGQDLLATVKMGPVLGSALDYLIDQGQQEQLLDFLLDKIKLYVAENEDMVRRRVKKESGILVPGFVDNMLANRITVGLANYLHEIQSDKNHLIRKEINGQLRTLATDLRAGVKWQADLEQLKSGLLSESQIHTYAGNFWQYIKALLLKELMFSDPLGTNLQRYLDKQLLGFAAKLQADSAMQLKIDQWVRYTAYRLALRNVDNAGLLISQTVGNWEGRQLSEKLELEVGKDLQFIRINGTVVGGLVGLLLYTITQFL